MTRNEFIKAMLLKMVGNPQVRDYDMDYTVLSALKVYDKYKTKDNVEEDELDEQDKEFFGKPLIGNMGVYDNKYYKALMYLEQRGVVTFRDALKIGKMGVLRSKGCGLGFVNAFNMILQNNGITQQLG